jgi:hypothetical protein
VKDQYIEPLSQIDDHVKVEIINILRGYLARKRAMAIRLSLNKHHFSEMEHDES